MLINAVAAPEQMLWKGVPEVLYIAMIDSLRRHFILGWDKQAETEKNQTAIERDILVPCVWENLCLPRPSPSFRDPWMILTDEISDLGIKWSVT